jgi:hypothetical protein
MGLAHLRELMINMESIPNRPVSMARFPRFEPDEVLYEFDGPRVFTVYDSRG